MVKVNKDMTIMGKKKTVVATTEEAPVEKVRKIVGGDGLVDGETTHGEDVKGNSTREQAEPTEATEE